MFVFSLRSSYLLDTGSLTLMTLPTFSKAREEYNLATSLAAMLKVTV